MQRCPALLPCTARVQGRLLPALGADPLARPQTLPIIGARLLELRSLRTQLDVLSVQTEIRIEPVDAKLCNCR